MTNEKEKELLGADAAAVQAIPDVAATEAASVCANCGQEAATENWGGMHDQVSLARNPWLIQRWCRRCVLIAQIAYMKSLTPLGELQRQLTALTGKPAKATADTFGDVPCEGCDVVGRGVFARQGRYPPRFPKMPSGWVQTGRSRKVPGAMASWCPSCMNKTWKYNNPSPREVRELIAKIGSGTVSPQR